MRIQNHFYSSIDRGKADYSNSLFQKEAAREEPFTEKMRQWLHKHVIDKMRIQNEMARQFLAEFIGTAFLLVSVLKLTQLCT